MAQRTERAAAPWFFGLMQRVVQRYLNSVFWIRTILCLSSRCLFIHYLVACVRNSRQWQKSAINVGRMSPVALWFTLSRLMDTHTLHRSHGYRHRSEYGRQAQPSASTPTALTKAERLQKVGANNKATYYIYVASFSYTLSIIHAIRVSTRKWGSSFLPGSLRQGSSVLWIHCK